MVRLENIAIGYEDGYEILSDLNFQLSKGSFHFLVGASGSGKSTLLKFLYMALQQARGQYFLSGNNVANLDRDEVALLRRRIGVVFQDFRLLDHFSTFENVALPLNVINEKKEIIQKERSISVTEKGMQFHKDYSRINELINRLNQKLTVP